MSKMKHLLRKLHIGGGGVNDHHPSSHRPAPSPTPSTPSPTEIQPIHSSPPPPPDISSDFSYLEEEFQVQLALAISASSADHQAEPCEDPDESAQIDAAKRISLGCCSASGSSAGDSEALVELLSLRYWSYNVVNYVEKVMDGFYDVYGIQSSAGAQGKMPLLVDLQAISVSDSVDYEVILVNRLVDPELRKLEARAMAIAVESRAFELGSVISDLVQKIADMVVQKMGGPVCDADEMLRKWTVRSNELRCLLNTIILPLGQIDVGLSRHRALLFKILADRIDLPCKLVKGSYYTGTDDGAVNLIKFDTGSEYIIDLMGAPGMLIPAEVPSMYLPSAELEVMTSAEFSLTVPEQATQKPSGEDFLGVFIPGVSSSDPGESPVISCNSKPVETNSTVTNQTERFEHDFGKLLPLLPKSSEGTSSISVKATPAQKMKVKNVSKYVISAAKNPEFAQKLHAVLLESGASPPPDLFCDTDGPALSEKVHKNSSVAGDRGGCWTQDNHDKLFNNELSLCSGVPLIDNVRYGYGFEHCVGESAKEVNILEKKRVNSDYSSWFDVSSEGFVLPNTGSKGNDAPRIVDYLQRQHGNASTSGVSEYIQEKKLGGNCCLDSGSGSKLVESTTSGTIISCSNGQVDKINHALGDTAELDIKWEDLQIGERIGIGSYGEVYRADWNGTEVAVKKFLDQDFSGEALTQFKCEVEIMLRMRHPNVVLFMGAVTRSPHFSILTEFLPRGSLYRLLHRPNPQVDERRRLRMALDVAKGMNYLHTSSPTIVHRDLKSPNLLVDKNWTIKVCDFGLSRMKHHTFLSSKSTAGTPEWMAPEVLRNEPANEKCDVYSFGVILWELTTMSIPWKGLNPMQVVGAVGFQNRRLDIPLETDPTVSQIIRECWETDPKLRPSFTQIMHRLRRLQRLVVNPTANTNPST